MSEDPPKIAALKVLGAVGLQAALVIWWTATSTATINARMDNDERRLVSIELFDQQMNTTANSISDRLARVEEKTQDELENIPPDRDHGANNDQEGTLKMIKEVTVLVLSFIILGAFILDSYLIMSGAIRTADPQVLLLIGNVSGAAQTFASMVVGYWFGTTKGSADKNVTIASMSDKIPTAPSSETIIASKTTSPEKT